MVISKRKNIDLYQKKNEKKKESKDTMGKKFERLKNECFINQTPSALSVNHTVASQKFFNHGSSLEVFVHNIKIQLSKNIALVKVK